MRAKRAVANHLGRHAAAAFAARWMWSNDYFVGMIGPADLRRPSPWGRFLSNLPTTGIVEWCVHPGEMDETLVGRDPYVAQRAVELTALTGDAGRAAWEQLRPRLCRKSLLARGDRE
jgi:hypothetical protein